MRNIDAKVEGIGFLIVKNENELENLRIPVGGIVKLQDSGKMLERTADGWKDYEMSGGSSGESNYIGQLAGYVNLNLDNGIELTFVATDEEKKLNAELYKIAYNNTLALKYCTISVLLKVNRLNSAIFGSIYFAFSQETENISFGFSNTWSNEANAFIVSIISSGEVFTELG